MAAKHYAMSVDLDGDFKRAVGNSNDGVIMKQSAMLVEKKRVQRDTIGWMIAAEYLYAVCKRAIVAYSSFFGHTPGP